MIKASRDAGKWLARKTPAARLKEQMDRLEARNRRGDVKPAKGK
jgi:hypothetical protein